MRLVKFHASWCAPCKALSATMSRVNIDIPMEEVNIEENPSEAIFYAVRSVPTLLLIDENGGVVARKGGNMSEDELKEFLKEAK